MKKVKRQLLLLLSAVVSCGAAWAQNSETIYWVKVTDYSNLSTNDTYVIAGNGISSQAGNGWFSLKNNRVTSSSEDNGIPIGSTLTLTEDLNRITSSISENETWTLDLVSRKNDVYYIISTKGDYYLQCTNDIGSIIDTKTSSNDAYCQWNIHYTNSNNAGTHTVTGLYNSKRNRELAVLRKKASGVITTEWRSYGPSNYNNISGEEVVLYRKVTSVPVSISSAKYASFSYGCPLDFSGTGITVYKAKGTEMAVTLTKVTDGIVPANTGVVLYSETATSQNVPVTALTGSTDWTDNELVGITERTKVSINGEEGKTNYILSKEGNVVGFYLAASGEGAYLAANRAYLSTSATHQLVPQYLGFEEETTGIESLTPTLSQGEGECYDLSGRHVAQPTKGMYIINGRKVVVK